MIKKVIWASMIDYPGNTSAVLFVGRCNFNCSYCYNRSLLVEKNIDFKKDILPKLIKRKDFVSHVIISGGEPTTDEEFENILTDLNDNDFTIGVHTNGSHPEIIKKHIDKIDFLGIDMKTSKNKYAQITSAEVDFKKVLETIDIAVKNGKKIEIRTTLFPKYVDINDCIEIAKTIKELGIKEYQLQQFFPVNGAEEVEPYTEEELYEIQQKCNKILPTILKTK